jgi:hypothetical protein
VVVVVATTIIGFVCGWEPMLVVVVTVALLFLQLQLHPAQSWLWPLRTRTISVHRRARLPAALALGSIVVSELLAEIAVREGEAVE